MSELGCTKSEEESCAGRSASVVGKRCGRFETFADLFAGTGAVASAFQEYRLITNDILYSNYLAHEAWFGVEAFDPSRVESLLMGYNTFAPSGLDNYMTTHFADTYFSRAVCEQIGIVREDIEGQYAAGRVNARERALLVTSLLYAMDRVANTCGHYDAYRKSTPRAMSLRLDLPDARVVNNPGNRCYNGDVLEVARGIEADVVYLDPPYNSRQYCDTYHLLENVARWEKPEVRGVARKMDRGSLRSSYCTQGAIGAFEELVGALRCRYILLSYNNMQEKGNGRSNAKMRDEDIMRVLEARGRVWVHSQEYRAFSAGRSNIEGNAERVFVCECGG